MRSKGPNQSQISSRQVPDKSQTVPDSPRPGHHGWSRRRRASVLGIAPLLLGLQALQPTLRLDLRCIKGEGTSIVGNGRGIIAKPLLRQTTVKISQREAPIEFDGPGEVSNRALVLLPIEEDIAAVVGDQGIGGIERQCRTVVRKGTVVLGTLGVDVGPVEIGGGEVFG